MLGLAALVLTTTPADHAGTKGMIECETETPARSRSRLRWCQ
jgi:hypothetical protein